MYIIKLYYSLQFFHQLLENPVYRNLYRFVLSYMGRIKTTVRAYKKKHCGVVVEIHSIFYRRFTILEVSRYESLDQIQISICKLFKTKSGSRNNEAIFF